MKTSSLSNIITYWMPNNWYLTNRWYKPITDKEELKRRYSLRRQRFEYSRLPAIWHNKNKYLEKYLPDPELSWKGGIALYKNAQSLYHLNQGQFFGIPKNIDATSKITILLIQMTFQPIKLNGSVKSLQAASSSRVLSANLIKVKKMAFLNPLWILWITLKSAQVKITMSKLQWGTIFGLFMLKYYSP